MANVQPRCSSAAETAPAQVVSPVAHTYRPRCSSTTAPACATRSSAPGPLEATRTSTASTRAYVATWGSAARSRSSPSSSATCDSPMPWRRQVRATISLPRPRASQPGQRLVVPHRTHLAGRAGQRDDDAALRPSNKPAGCRAVRIRQCFGRRDPPGLLEIDLGKGHPAPFEAVAEPCLHLRVDRRFLADEGGDRLARQVVGGRSESAGGHDEVRTAERGLERATDHLEVVGECLQPEDLHAPRGQVAGQLARVRVTCVADRDLAADAQQLSGQQPPIRRGIVHLHEGTVRRLPPAGLIAAFGTIGSSTAAGTVLMLGALDCDRVGRRARTP